MTRPQPYQTQHFPDGSAVQHKRFLSGSNCRFSIWFNADGSVKDAERIDALGRSYEPTARQMAALRKQPIILRHDSEVPRA